MRSKHYWYFFVRVVLKRYGRNQLGSAFMDRRFKNAIQSAIDITAKMKDGEDRLRAIDLIYFRGTHNQIGAGMEIHVSSRTIQRWDECFVKLVGKKAGFD